jgi:cyanophycin synthetase
MRVGKGRVLVDYAHNPAAIAGLMDFVYNLDAARRIGIITAPGDRRDEDLRTVGRLSAKLDRVIVREDKYRRGREPGEVARLIIEGLKESGMTDSQIEIIYNETEGLAYALTQMEDNDLVFVLADDVPAVLSQLDRLAADRPHD